MEHICPVCNKTFKGRKERINCSFKCSSIAKSKKTSHRKGISMVEEYGDKKAKLIKKTISKKVKDNLAKLSKDDIKKKYGWAKGKSLSQEHKVKINPKGRRHSLQTKLKMSNIVIVKNGGLIGRNGVLWKSISKELRNISKRCSICKSEKNIIVHHKDFNPKNNNINNLLVLCKKCHFDIHNKNGDIKW